VVLTPAQKKAFDAFLNASIEGKAKSRNSSFRAKLYDAEEHKAFWFGMRIGLKAVPFLRAVGSSKGIDLDDLFDGHIADTRLREKKAKFGFRKKRRSAG
jgi:hypothetical protein